MNLAHPLSAWRIVVMLCLLALTCAALAAPPSPLRFKRLGALGSDEWSVLALIQDRQGFIWIGTNSGGLYRYNGYQAVKYQNSQGNPRSLPHDRVSTVFEDKAGRIWAGTQDGLVRFNPETDDFTRFVPSAGPDNRMIVKGIVGDAKGGMWLATWGGLQHFDPASGRFTVHAHDPARPDSLASNDVNAVLMDEHGGVWAATWPGGLDYLAPGATRFRHFRIDSGAAPDSKLNIARALHLDRSGTLWIGTENGVVTWDTGRDWSERRRIDSPNSRVTAFFPDTRGTLWAATLAAGLLRYDPGTQRLTRFAHLNSDPHSLPSDNVRAVIEDRAGMLWIGTYTDGIALANLNSDGFATFIPHEADGGAGQVNNLLQYIDGAPDGHLWLAGNSGFALYDPARGSIVRQYRTDRTRPGTLSNDIVYSLYQEPGGPLWVGTSAGLNRLDKADGQIKVVTFDDAASNFINAIAPGRGGVLWLGTGNSLIRYHADSGAHRSYRHVASDPYSRSVDGSTTVLEDRKGRVWIGSEWNGGGLDMLDPATGRFTHFRRGAGGPHALSDDNVVSLHQDASGRLWVGTSKGLNEIITLPDGRIGFRSFASPDGVGLVKINTIESDRAGRIWMSTASGLTRLDPVTGKAARFTPSDGLTEGFSVGASHGGGDGRLYFGGVRGVTVVDPPKVRSTSIAPQVAITDISVFNRSLKEGKRADIKLSGSVTAPTDLTLSVQESVFSLDFAALHYTDPALNRHAYRLVGFDRDWVETDATRRSATYTNLDPGTYLFEVKAANDRGVWSTDSARLTITILPPYWQTWWFRTLSVAGVLALLGLAYHMRVRRLTRNQLELEALVAARTRELETSNSKLAALSTTDGLTGVANRRGFDAALANEWRRARRNGHGLALLMIDVDHFKKFNDQYGHLEGDEALRRVAAMIAGHGRRPSDLVARYGGEEFVMLSPATDLAHGLEIARGIIEDLARLALPHEGSPYGSVTLSVGVAALMPGDDSSQDELIRQADLALYQAKQDGRNCARGSLPEDAPRQPATA